MTKASASHTTLKRLVETNIKTQEAVGQVVSSIKELISALREAGEEETKEIKSPEDTNVSAISAKLDRLIQQNLKLIKVVEQLTELIKKRAGSETPPQPPAQWRRL